MPGAGRNRLKARSPYGAGGASPVPTESERMGLKTRHYKGKRVLAFVAEALDVFGAFFEGGDVAALDLFANLGDDVGIGEGGDVAGVHVVGNGGENAAHDFARAGLGHVRNNVDCLWARDFADHGLDR